MSNMLRLEGLDSYPLYKLNIEFKVPSNFELDVKISNNFVKIALLPIFD